MFLSKLNDDNDDDDECHDCVLWIIFYAA